MKGIGNMAKMFGDLPKVQKIIQVSLAEFAEMEREETHQDMIVFRTKGDQVKSVTYLDSYINLIAEDKEMAEDLLISGLNSIQSKLNQLRMEKLERDAVKSKLSPQLVKQIFNNELLSGLM